MAAVHIRVIGKVQGVFYRATAREVAEAQGLKGWIRNTEEGEVEAVVTGTTEQIETFCAWCRRGPEDAVVRDVLVTPVEETPFEQFKVIR
jgi:acylphosphatase